MQEKVTEPSTLVQEKEAIDRMPTASPKKRL